MTVSPDPAVTQAYQRLQSLATTDTHHSGHPDFEAYLNQPAGGSEPQDDGYAPSLTDLKDQLGELSDAPCELSQRHLVSAFMADVAVDPTDVVLLAAPSTQIWEVIHRLWYGRIAATGVFVTTKHPPAELQRAFDRQNPCVVDAMPESNGSVDRSGDESRSVDCRDLTSLGVAMDQLIGDHECDSTENLPDGAGMASSQAGSDSEVFGFSTLNELLLYHDVEAVAQFLHLVSTRLRRRSVGAIVHGPPEATPRGDRSSVVASVDYVVEGRTRDDGVVLTRVHGKRGVAPRWRAIGVVDDSIEA